jgi:hypothetical protein
MPSRDAWDGVKALARKPCERHGAGAEYDCLTDRSLALDPESNCPLALRIEARDDGYPCLPCQARLTVASDPKRAGERGEPAAPSAHRSGSSTKESRREWGRDHPDAPVRPPRAGGSNAPGLAPDRGGDG